MNIGGNATELVRRTGIANEKRLYASADKYNEMKQFNLNMYLQPDTGTITLEEFQNMGMKRLSILKKLEKIKEKHGSNADKYREVFIKDIGNIMPLMNNSCINAELVAARAEDRISHFILRLAFCHAQDQADWFIRQETELFRMRFHFETTKNIQNFLSANGIKLDTVSIDERNQFSDEICQSLTVSTEEVSKLDVYKVDFTDVTELLSTYRIFLQDGFAYLSSNDLIAIVTPRFRENLVASLAYARKHIGSLQEEDRLIPLMKHIMHGGIAYRADFQDPNAEYISPDSIDSLARSSFPLCMRQIHNTLRREHHLRHFARRQYGLFLKGVGLSMEGALEFFRAEFCKKMDSEKFTKEYAYNIRHIYGKEGSRIDQKPLSCATIILGSAPTVQDCHGCPFKHSDETHLNSQLEAAGLTNDQMRHIIELSKCNRFDKACTKYFEYTHDVPELEDIITHPNQFYSLSRKIRGSIGTSKIEE